MRKRPNPKVYLMLMVLTLVVGAGLSYMQFSSLQEVQAKVEKLRKDAKDEKEVQAELDTINATVDETKTKLIHLEQGVSEVAYVPTLLKELEDVGTKAGLQVLGVRPIPKVAKPMMRNTSEDDRPKVRKPYTEMDIEVRGKGEYRSLMNFLRALQMFPKIIAARTVSVQPKSGVRDEDRGKPPVLEVTLELRSYLFAPDGPTKKDAKADLPAEKEINVSGRNKMAVNP